MLPAWSGTVPQPVIAWAVCVSSEGLDRVVVGLDGALVVPTVLTEPVTEVVAGFELGRHLVRPEEGNEVRPAATGLEHPEPGEVPAPQGRSTARPKVSKVTCGGTIMIRPGRDSTGPSGEPTISTLIRSARLAMTPTLPNREPA